MALGSVAEIAAGQGFKQGYGNRIARKRCNHKALGDGLGSNFLACRWLLGDAT